MGAAEQQPRVWAPGHKAADSNKSMSQVVTIKSKFIVENQTGMPLEIKQRGTPDLDETPTAEERCARMLLHDQRCVLL